MAVPPDTITSFFSGYGALDRAVSRVFRQSRCILYVENELTAVQGLAAGMEQGTLAEAPVWSDARTVPTGLFRGRTDMVVGGFPCTDISLAGRGDGIYGEHSGLFFALRDAIRDLGPRYVFLENVAALTLRGLDAVLGALAEIGLDVVWGCLRADDVGAPHRRDRWWCLAWSRRRLAEPARLGGSQQSFIDDGGWSLGGAEPWSDGRVVDGRVTARVSQRGGAYATGQEGLRVGQASLGHGGGRQLQRLGESGVLASAGRLVEREGDQRERGRHPAGSPGQGSLAEAVGDPERQGLALRATLRRDVGEERQAAQRAGATLVGIPEWPPLPDDTEGWLAVLAHWPELAPALPEPTLRGVVDVGSGWDRHDVPWAPCDCNRADQLRGLGNSVCTAQAEAALRLLWLRAFGSLP